MCISAPVRKGEKLTYAKSPFVQEHEKINVQKDEYNKYALVQKRDKRSLMNWFSRSRFGKPAALRKIYPNTAGARSSISIAPSETSEGRKAQTGRFSSLLNRRLKERQNLGERLMARLNMDKELQRSGVISPDPRSALDQTTVLLHLSIPSIPIAGSRLQPGSASRLGQPALSRPHVPNIVGARSSLSITPQVVAGQSASPVLPGSRHGQPALSRSSLADTPGARSSLSLTPPRTTGGRFGQPALI